MSQTAMALSSDHPMMIAWNKFCETDEFRNALHWALTVTYEDGRVIDPFYREQHFKGSMWLAFTKGMEESAAPGPEPVVLPANFVIMDVCDYALSLEAKLRESEAFERACYDTFDGGDNKPILDLIRGLKQQLADAQAERDAAFDEAAKVADEIGQVNRSMDKKPWTTVAVACDGIASSIRALKRRKEHL